MPVIEALKVKYKFVEYLIPCPGISNVYVLGFELLAMSISKRIVPVALPSLILTVQAVDVAGQIINPFKRVGPL